MRLTGRVVSPPQSSARHLSALSTVHPVRIFQSSKRGKNNARVMRLETTRLGTGERKWFRKLCDVRIYIAHKTHETHLFYRELLPKGLPYENDTAAMGCTTARLYLLFVSFRRCKVRLCNVTSSADGEFHWGGGGSLFQNWFDRSRNG